MILSQISWTDLREHECEDSDSLVVIGPCHGPGDVAGHDCYEAGGKQSGALGPQLFGQQISRNGSQATAEEPTLLVNEMNGGEIRQQFSLA